MSENYNKLRNLLRKNKIETPENKLILDILQAHYPNNGRMAEWLHREIRKERLRCDALGHLERFKELTKKLKSWEATEVRIREGHTQEEITYQADRFRRALREQSQQLESPQWLKREINKPIWADADGNPERITVALLKAAEEALTLRKQRGEEARIMKLQATTVFTEAKEYRLTKKALEAGEVVYRFEDGWSIRRIQNADEASLEGEMLGHCIRQYATQIEAGNSHNYSLRDNKGMAHLTLEIKHKEQPRPPFEDVIAEVMNVDHECPYCNEGVVSNGECSQCHHDLNENVEYYNTRQGEGRMQEKQFEIGQRMWLRAVRTNLREELEEAQEGFTEENNHTEVCPCCQSQDVKPFRGRRLLVKRFKLKCNYCRSVFWSRGKPAFPLDDDIYIRSGYDCSVYGPEVNLEEFRNAYVNMLPATDQTFLNGDAYQIQGKQNICPAAKYHPYLQEWMHSIDYDERPKATWSSYYTKTPVLHVDDLESGGTKGEDDFGFRWWDRNEGKDGRTFRPFDWNSIINSLHGKPKRWWDEGGAENTEKKFLVETVPDRDVKYVPELGHRLFDFVAQEGYLEQLAAALKAWADKLRTHGVDGEKVARWEQYIALLECPRCGHKGKMKLAQMGYPEIIVCRYCNGRMETREIFEKYGEPPSGEAAELSFTPYQKEVLGDLGMALEKATAKEKTKFVLRDVIYVAPTPEKTQSKDMAGGYAYSRKKHKWEQRNRNAWDPYEGNRYRW